MYIVCSKIEVNGSRNANWEQGGGQKLLDGQVNGKMQNGKIRIDRFEISNVLKSQKIENSKYISNYYFIPRLEKMVSKC